MQYALLGVLLFCVCVTVQATPYRYVDTVLANASAESLPYCPGGGECAFVYDLIVDFDTGTMVHFDGWMGANYYRISRTLEDGADHYQCAELPSTLQIVMETVYTGGYLRLTWIYAEASPDCTQSSQWIDQMPLDVQLEGVLPDGTLLTPLPSSISTMETVQMAAPGDDLCMDCLARGDAISWNVPNTGCPASGDCDTRMIFRVDANSLALIYYDMLVGPKQASSRTIIPSSQTFFVQCDPFDQNFYIRTNGNGNELVAQWPLFPNDCTTVMSDWTFYGSGSMIEFNMNIDEFGIVLAPNNPFFSNNTFQQSSVPCQATYTTTPSISQSATVTPSNSASTTVTASSTPTPTRTPSISLTTTISPTASRTASQTISGTPTLTRTGTSTPTPSITATPTRTPTASNTPSNSPVASASNTPSNTPTPSGTGTASNTPTPSSSNTPSTSLSSSETPTPSQTGSLGASATPTTTTTRTPTPTGTGTASSTALPTPTPSSSPTSLPSASPTSSATRTPSSTRSPSGSSTRTPSNSGTRTPSPTSGLTTGGGGSNGLSPGAVAGITVGSVVGVAAIALLIYGCAAYISTAQFGGDDDAAMPPNVQSQLPAEYDDDASTALVDQMKL